MRLSINIILKNISTLLGVKTDADVARGLGVARQTLSTWKRRGTIPYEQLCQLAEEKDVSLDYLLLGKGKCDFNGGDIDSNLLMAIEHELLEYGCPDIHPLLPNYAYEISLIYNKVNHQIRPGISTTELVKGEVKYFLEIRKISTGRNTGDE